MVGVRMRRNAGSSAANRMGVQSKIQNHSHQKARVLPVQEGKLNLSFTYFKFQMTSNEYFLILPMLLYGLAIADLVGSWRRFLVKEQQYAPYIVTTILLLEVSFYNFYQLNQYVTVDTFKTYFAYFKVLISPLIFLVVVAVLTPDKDTPDLKGYFKKYMHLIFGGMALFVAAHFLVDPLSPMAPRLISIGFLLITAIFRKEWMVYALILLRIGTWLVLF
jgi:hypothetical protein